MAKVPKTRTDLAPISEISKVIEPIGQKNVAGDQINPAIQDTLTARVDQSYVDNCYVEASILAQLAATLAQFVPLEVAAQHGTAETASTDILGNDITPTNTPCLFRIMVMLETTGVFSAVLKNGAVTKGLKLNGGVELTINCAYIFDILVHSGDTVNFQTSASGNVTLRVQEIVAGVQ